MNEEELKEAIEILKNGLHNPKVKSENCFYFDEYQMNTIKNMTYTLEKELAQEKEKNKKLEEERLKLHRTINLMMEDLTDCDVDFCCEDCNIEKCTSKDDWAKFAMCIKNYYFRKARGE